MMKPSATSLFSILVLTGVLTAYLLHADPTPSPSQQKPMESLDKTPEQPQKPVKLSDAEWKKRLTPEQYQIARKAGTERANGNVYKQFQKQGAGTYFCAGCNAELFSSKTKFDSHCGWPSFYDPSKAKNVISIPDPDGRRVEVRCKMCDAHLGHVFKGEGYGTPTDQRYCINGTVLKFVPDQKEKPAGKK